MARRARPWTKLRFRAEMAVMAAQRNTKIVGIFARLSCATASAVSRSMPRVWDYLEHDLRHPLLPTCALV